MDNTVVWRSRLHGFKRLLYTSIYIDDNVKTEILLDILQDLFSEHLKEDLRIELVLFIEENIDILIPDIDRAEQAFGSLQNVFDFLGNHLVALKCQVLNTMTVLAVVFDFKENKQPLYQELINHFLDTIFKVNSGHPLLRKTCSQCLILFGEHFKDGLCEHISTLLATAKAERSFASYDHTLLLAFLTYHISKSVKRDNSGTEAGKSIQSEINKCVSFFIDQTRTLSVTSLVQLMRKLLPCLEKGRISRSLLNNLLQYSIQSWDLLLTYFAVYAQTNYPHLLHSQYGDDQMMTLLMKLLLARGMDQFPKDYTTLMHYWINGVFKHLPETIHQNASFMAFTSLQPTIYEKITKLPLTFESIVSVAKHCKTEIPLEIQSKMLEMTLKSVNTIRSPKDTSAFFISLFRLYCHSSDKIKGRIISLVEEMAVRSLQLSINVIDFCESIEKRCYKGCSVELLKRTMERLLKLNVKAILPVFKYYLLLVQHVAGMKDIWPMAIVKKLDVLVKTSVLDNCSWSDGSLLLSVCKEFLICHGNLADVRFGVASVLWTISQNFQDFNISDRAMFYYLVIGNVSHKYFPSMLISHSENKDNGMDQFGEVAKVMNSGLPFINRVKENFLSFKMDKECEYEDRLITKKPDCTILECYRKSLMEDDFNKTVKKKFKFAFIQGETNEKEPEEAGEFNEIYGCNIELKTNGPFGETTNIVCPYLSKSKRNQQSSDQSFDVRFHPVKPSSAKFSMSVTFLDKETRCWSSSLPSFWLTFADIIQPLPKIEEENTLQEELFDQIWEDIVNDQKTITNSLSTKALSVKSLPHIKKENLLSTLEALVVKDETDLVKIGMYLPPSNTALVKFEFNEVRTIARLAVDDYATFDDLDKFVEIISKQVAEK